MLRFHKYRPKTNDMMSALHSGSSKSDYVVKPSDCLEKPLSNEDVVHQNTAKISAGNISTCDMQDSLKDVHVVVNDNGGGCSTKTLRQCSCDDAKIEIVIEH